MPEKIKRGRKNKINKEVAEHKSGEVKKSGFLSLLECLSQYSNHRYAIIAGLILLCIAIFIIYAFPLFDPDLWWHMKLGEYMVENLTLKPDHSIYSWTVADPNWIYNAWVPEVVFYIAHKIGGVMALHILHYLFLFSIMGLFLYFNYKLGQSLNPFYLLLMLSVFISLYLNAILRPEMFSIVFVTLTAFIYFYSISKGKNLFWLYPVLMLIWVNSHGVFVFGIIFITTAFIGELIHYSIRRNALSKQILMHFFISVVLSYVALIVTPYGPKWILSIVKYFTDPKFMQQARELIAYKSVFAFYHPTKYILIAMAVLYFLMSIYIFFAKRYFNIVLMLLNGLFIYLSFMYARTAYLYLPVFYFSIVYLMSISNIMPRLSRLSPIFLAGFLLFSGWTVHWTIYYPLRYNYSGSGVGEYMPEKTADFLLKHKLEGPIFNTYEIGGYLLWRLYPEYRVFIDPRHGPYTKHLSDDYRQFEIGNIFEAFTNKYSFKTAVVKLEWIVLITNFFKSPDWKLVYFDTSAATFTHKTAKMPENLNVDLGPERFKNTRSYEALVHVMYAYLNMDDFKSAWYIMDLIKNRYNYGDYREKIEITVEKIRKYENERREKKSF